MNKKEAYKKEIEQELTYSILEQKNEQLKNYIIVIEKIKQYITDKEADIYNPYHNNTIKICQVNGYDILEIIKECDK